MRQGTTRRINNIQVLKGVYSVTMYTTGIGLQGHPIGFSNHFHLFDFDVHVLLLYFLFYFILLLKEMYAATLHGTTRGNNDIQVLKGVCSVTVYT